MEPNSPSLRDRLATAVKASGALAVALDDAIARGELRFTAPPTDTEIADWIAALKVAAPHFYPRESPPPPDPQAEVIARLSPVERLTRGRAAQIVAASHNEPVALRAPELAEVQKMSPLERLTRGHAMQAQQRSAP